MKYLDVVLHRHISRWLSRDEVVTLWSLDLSESTSYHLVFQETEYRRVK
jgi:hypothetical protein